MPWYRAVRAIDSIQEVVEACSHLVISYLIQSDISWIDQSHGILKIQVALAIVVEARHVLLDSASVNGVEDGTVSNLLRTKVFKE